MFSLAAHLQDMFLRSIPGGLFLACHSVTGNLRRGGILAADDFVEVMSPSVALPEVISLADGFAKMVIIDHHSG